MDFMELIEIPSVDDIKLTRLVFDENLNKLKYVCSDGSICLTIHYLIFNPKDKVDDEQEIWIVLSQNKILHSLIDALELKVKETRFTLIIKCKNFQIFEIEFKTQEQLNSVSKSLDSLSNLTSDSMKFPFYNQFNAKIIPEDWNLHSVEQEFIKYFGTNNQSCEWRITEINKDYSICSTYPQKLIVPKNVDDAMLVKSSQFRAGHRFPVLSYYHKSKQSFMMRSSQPLLGSNNRRCKEDESLLKIALPMGKKGYIYDLRDANILKYAQSKGGGYETDANYPLWKRINRHLERYDQLQVSFSKLIDICTGDTSIDKFFNKLESTGWFTNTRQILHTTSCIAYELNNNNGCVLVHGWEGTDNTLIITSLVQILLNPECRTLKGFEILIEREWLHVGHPFSRRCFKSSYGSTSQKFEGPVFILFLDCVRQIMDQFCLSFEFNEDFLIFLADNAYASKYGTFLGNCQRERDQLMLSSRTSSLWTYVNSSEATKEFINPLYEPNSAALWPSLYPQALSLWTNLFLRYQKNNSLLKEAKTETQRLTEENKQSRTKVDQLRNKLMELQKQALSMGLVSSKNDIN